MQFCPNCLFHANGGQLLSTVDRHRPPSALRVLSMPSFYSPLDEENRLEPLENYAIGFFYD